MLTFRRSLGFLVLLGTLRTIHALPSTKAFPAMPESNQGCLTVCAIQPNLRPDEQTPQDAIQDAINLMKKASIEQKEKIDLFVLPELSPIGYSEDTFARHLPTSPEKKAIYQQLDSQMAQAAKELQAFVCYGTVGSHPHQQLTIRQIVLNPNGHTEAIYDKIYPCDFGDCAETRFFVSSPSKKPVSFSIRDFRIGIIICADQRVPTLTRAYAKPPHNVDLILQPAAFYRDCSFPSWKAFRETRAIENSVYFLGVNYAGKDYGESTLVPPWVDDDHRPMSLNCDQGCMICHILRSELEHVRTNFPFYKIAQAEAS